MHISQSLFRRFLLPAALGSLLVFTGCAATGTKDVKGGAGDNKAAKAEEKPAASRTSVEYINVVGEGDRVLIGTTGSVKYTVFRLTDPSRLIVDMPGVDLEKVAPSLDVNNEYLSDINAISYGEQKEIGRIVIGLKDGVEHEVKSGENSILVSLRKGEGAEEAPAPVAQEEPVKEEPIAEAEAPKTAEPIKEAVRAEESAPEKQASKILKIDSAREGENFVIKIVTDGSVGNFNSFELDSPSRIVVDVWGVGNSTGKGAVKIDNKYVKAVRIGTHPGKARLVFDSSKKKLPAHNIRKEANAIVITLGPGVAEAAKPVAVNANFVAKESPAPAAPVVTAQAENSEEAAPAPETETAPALEPEAAPAPAEEAPAARSKATIDKVDFKKVNGSGRLTIASSAKATYDLKESQDGKTVVLDIHDSVIPEELKRTLDARKLNTAVELVSSYQEAGNVRVLVKLSDKVSYDVREENGGITIDFAAPAPAETIAKNGAAEAPAAAQAEPKKEDADFAKKQYTGKRIDLDMVDANITDIIRLLAEVSNLNIIASDEVKGTISLRLKNVPWDQAFDIILKSKDLDQIKEGNVVRVAPASKIRQEKEAVLASRRAQEKLENLETRYIPVSYATPDELIPHVKTMLSDRGAVTSEKRTSTLIIRDIPRSLDAAEELIKRLDKATPQVLIEARIIEASSSFARDLGIQWGVDYRTGGNVHTDVFGSGSSSGQTAIDPGVQTGIASSPAFPTSKSAFPTRIGATNYAVNLPASGTAGTLGALGFILGKAGANPLILDLRLSAGESEGKVKIISRPRIATLDNKEAKIEQGESVPFETTSASGTATTFIDANLSLTVTPHITPDGSVSMKIKASKNSIGTFRTASGQPSINKKESTTEVLVKDGETTVIGGIVISDKTDSDKGIPFLKDIPVLGWLFKSKSIADTQTELLIFITPTIIQGKDKIVG